MALHRLTSIEVGVPEVAPVAEFYRDLGLVDTPTGGFATRDGGEQLRLVVAPHRRLVEVGIGADDPDDLDRVAASLAALDVAVERSEGRLLAVEPVTGTRVVVEVAPRYAPPAWEPDPVNAPGHDVRRNRRAPAILREDPVRPSKLGHVVLGSPDQPATQRFFTEGIGCRVSDEITGIASFLRCSDEHHNLLVQAAPLTYLHHTSWTVADVDEIGRGAHHVLAADPSRHVWGLGRHWIGSNNFWYLRDPAGNFAELHSDLDRIDDDAAWEASSIADLRALYAWGPPVPSEFILPDDIAARAAAE
jgi:catechol 2,3-dioxygenase-like lactoylglutathione lyase family enzyme